MKGERERLTGGGVLSVSTQTQWSGRAGTPGLVGRCPRDS